MNSLFAPNGILAQEMEKAEIALRDNRRSAIVLAVVEDRGLLPNDLDPHRLRDEAMWEVAARLEGKYTFYELSAVCLLPQGAGDSIPRYCRQLTERPACLFVHSLEQVAREDPERYQRLLTYLNNHREDIRDTQTALVLWLTPATLHDLEAQAPDFADWRTACVAFTVQPGVLVPRTAPLNVTVEEADTMRRQLARYDAMLEREGLSPALAAEFQQQRSLLYRRLAQPQESEQAARQASDILTPLYGIAQAERAYLDYLINLHDRMEARGVSQTVREAVPLPLDEVYISLTAEREVLSDSFFSEREYRDREEGFNHTSRGGREAQERDFPLSRMRRETRSQPIDLPRAVRDSQRAVFLGDPGAGKTTLLRFLAVRFAHACREDAPRVRDREGNDYGEPRLPILVRVAEFALALQADRSLRLDSFLARDVEKAPVKAEALHQMLEDALQNGRALILLDGLDEVVRTDDRSEIARRIEEFVAGKGAGNAVLVTSRIAGYPGARLGGAFQTYTLRDMDADQRTRFLERWCEACERYHHREAPEAQIVARARMESNALLAAIAQSEGVQRLAKNPLLLTILALIHRNGGRLPERRVELYELATKTLLRTWRLAQVRDARGVDETEAEELLAPLAYKMHCDTPTGLLPEAELHQRLCCYYAEAHHLQPNAEAVRTKIDDFLIRLREHSGLLVERATGQYGFLHLTFEEYFAARYMVSDFAQAPAFLRKHRHQPRFEEPIRLAIAMKSVKDAAFLIRAAIWDPAYRPTVWNRLLRRPTSTGYTPSDYEEYLRRDLLLAARCLGDCIGVEASLAQALAAELEAICLRRAAKNFEPLRQKVLDTLPSLGQGEVREALLPSLLTFLRDDKVDENVRVCAAESLSQLGQATPEIVNALLSVLQDGEVDWQVRMSVVWSLGQLGQVTPEVVNTLLSVLRDGEVDENVRGHTASSLVQLGQATPEVVSGLLTVLQDEKVYYGVRSSIAETLGKVRQSTPEVVSVLLSVLRNKKVYYEVRSSVAWCLGQLGQSTPEVISGLLSVLRDKTSVSVRGSAVWSLGRLGQSTPEVISGLLSVLRDEKVDNWMRVCAAWSLVQLGQATPEVVNTLLSVLRYEKVNEYLRVRAASSLVQLGQATPEINNALLRGIRRGIDSAWVALWNHLLKEPQANRA